MQEDCTNAENWPKGRTRRLPFICCVHSSFVTWSLQVHPYVRGRFAETIPLVSVVLGRLKPTSFNLAFPPVWIGGEKKISLLSQLSGEILAALEVASYPAIPIWRRGEEERLLHTVVRMHLISKKSWKIGYPGNFSCNSDATFVEFLQPQYSLVWSWHAVQVLCLVVRIFLSCVIRSSEVSDFAYIVYMLQI